MSPEITIIHPLEIKIEGDPVPKARARIVRYGHAYTPRKTANWEKIVRLTAISAMNGRQMLTGPVQAKFWFYLPMPRNIPKKRRPTALPHHRPDLDNLVKSVKDALNGVAYHDDGQIVKLSAQKTYGTPAGVRITIAPAFRLPPGCESTSEYDLG